MIAGIMYGISVFVGIVAGIAVTIGVDFLKKKKQNANDKNNLSFEIKCNLSSAIFSTTNKLLQDGRIYTYLSYNSIEKIQENGTYLSLAAENMLNNQITQYKQAAWNGNMNVKQFAANDIDFWDKALKICKENFMDILKELK